MSDTKYIPNSDDNIKVKEVIDIYTQILIDNPFFFL